jgi:hypothetical protein
LWTSCSGQNRKNFENLLQHQPLIIIYAFSLVQLISTDERPVEIHYVEPLDQLLVVCWGQQDGVKRTEGTRTVIVIREASDEKRHSVVHVWPVDGLQLDGPVNIVLFILSFQL